MRVQLEGRARGCHPRGEGSIPFTRSEGNHENTEKALDKWNVVHHDHFLCDRVCRWAAAA